MTELSSFGEWLKRQRMGRGLTREQLANQIGCAVVTLRKIEAEERRPSAQIVERLAEIFNIPQNERTGFLKYARGDWQAAPTGIAENDFQGAVVYAQKVLALKREMGAAAEIAFGLNLVGIFQYKQGNVEAAMRYVRDSLEFVPRGEVGNRILINIFVYLGGLFVEKRTQVTTQILAFTESLVQSSAVRRDTIFDEPYFDRFVSVARAKLSEAEFTSAWEAGPKMIVEEAIELVLHTLEEI